MYSYQFSSPSIICITGLVLREVDAEIELGVNNVFQGSTPLERRGKK